MAAYHSDFNHFIHSLRTEELRRVPKGAEVFLSAGCSGTWYFEWIKQEYGHVRQHVGIEAYAPRPEGLPPEVQWIPDQIHNMKSVSEASVDLVFAGQTLEHLWLEECIGFLTEAHRTLRPGGLLVMDSPNREVTELLNYSMSEHTCEFASQDVPEILALAGFSDVDLRGVWLCREKGKLLPLQHSESDYTQRAHDATTHPNDCFIWWAEARKSPRAPDVPALRAKLETCYKTGRKSQLGRWMSRIGTISHPEPGTTVITSKPGDLDYSLFGPFAAISAGQHTVKFRVCTDREYTGEEVACVLDVLIGNDEFATIPVRACDLRKQFGTWSVDFQLNRMRFGIQFRLRTGGTIPISVVAPVEFVERPWSAVDGK